MTGNRNTPYLRSVQQNSLSVIGLLTIVHSYLEIYFIGPSLESYVGFAGGIFYLGLGLQRFWQHNVSKMSLYLVVTGLVFLSYRIWTMNGLNFVSACWYLLFPIYAILFNRPWVVRLSILGSILAMAATSYFERTFPHHNYDEYPELLATLLSAYILPILIYHLHLLSMAMSHMLESLEQQRAITLFHFHQSSLGKLSAQIVQEVNTPLNSLGTIMGHIKEAIPAHQFSEPLAKLFGQHENILKRISTTIGAIMRSSGDTRDPAATPPNFELIAEDLYTLMGCRLRNYKVEFTIILPPQPKAECPFLNHTLVLQVLSTLVNNSFDSIVGAQGELPESRTWVKVTMNIANSNLVIDVEDGGPRIPKKYIKKIFESGFSTKASGEKGYGLTMAREILTEAGGRIEYLPESDYTHFRATIPCTKGKS